MIASGKGRLEDGHVELLMEVLISCSCMKQKLLIVCLYKELIIIKEHRHYFSKFHGSNNFIGE